MLNSFLHWLVNSPWSHWINLYEWVFPVIQSVHFIGFAVPIGTIAMVDLRLLGFGMRRQTPAELAADLDRWTLVGIAMMLFTGFLMFSTDAVTYHNNPSFQVKMTCFMVALAFHFTIRRRAVRPRAGPAGAKLAAVVSLLLWTTVLAAGRMIAFV
jgi:hypothetical protein